jgi:hypothetical protein
MIKHLLRRRIKRNKSGKTIINFMNEINYENPKDFRFLWKPLREVSYIM